MCSTLRSWEIIKLPSIILLYMPSTCQKLQHIIYARICVCVWAHKTCIHVWHGRKWVKSNLCAYPPTLGHAAQLLTAAGVVQQPLHTNTLGFPVSWIPIYGGMLTNSLGLWESLGLSKSTSMIQRFRAVLNPFRFLTSPSNDFQKCFREMSA